MAYLERVEAAANIPGQKRVTDFTTDACANVKSVTERGTDHDRVTTLEYDTGLLWKVDGPRVGSGDLTTYIYGAARRVGLPDQIEDGSGKRRSFLFSPYGVCSARRTATAT